MKSELANDFPRLQIIFEKLNNQNILIHKKEQVLVESNRELESMKGIFKGKQRKVLQEKIGELTTQIASMKQHLSGIVLDYGYKNIKAFLVTMPQKQITTVTKKQFKNGKVTPHTDFLVVHGWIYN